MTDSVTVTAGYVDGLFQAKVIRNGSISVNATKVLKTALEWAPNFSSVVALPSIAGDSVTVTAGYKNNLFEANVERGGYIEVDVAKVLSRAIEQGLAFKPNDPLPAPSELPSSDDEDEEVLTPPVKRYIGRKRSGCREPTLCFTDGQKIRHKCRGADGWWVGVFHNSPTWTGIDCEGMSFSADDCISQLARAHYYNQGLNPNAPPPLYSYWNECECQIDGQWISTYDLPSLK
jgi:hypothetical protein